jgi:transcriptional regulator with PAS, ATPase and Fis domain
VNDLPLHLQAKLLDVLQRNTIRAIGSDQETRVDMRIVAASNQPLKPLLQQNRFRADLYHRLNVVSFCLPPLRSRMQDLPALVLAFAHRHREIYQPIETVEPELTSLLQRQLFPGNVRELENSVQRMLFLKAGGNSLGLSDWHARLNEPRLEEHADLLGDAAAQVWREISAHGMPYAQAIRQIEKRVLEAALHDGTSNRKEIAQRLHTSERTLYHKIRTYDLGSARRS